MFHILKFDFHLFLLSEPNIDSPLNTMAADLWKNQTAYKKKLTEHYDRNVRNATK